MFKRIFRVRILMKSGNVLELDHLSKFHMEFNGKEITKMDWACVDVDKAHIKWIALDQIETIIQVSHRLHFSLFGVK